MELISFTDVNGNEIILKGLNIEVIGGLVEIQDFIKTWNNKHRLRIIKGGKDEISRSNK